MDHVRPSTSGFDGLYRRRKSKAFNESWLDNDIFKSWLKLHSDGTSAYCIVCDKVLVCGKSELLRHASRKIHIYNISRPNRDKTFANNLPTLLPITDNISHTEKVKQAENKLETFCTEYNIDADSSNQMLHFLQEICMERQVVSDISLSRRKCTLLVTHVIGKCEDEGTIENLKQQNFSILLDEVTTAIANDKILSIFVKFVDRNSKKPTTKLLELIKLDEKNCSAKEIYLAFKSCLEHKGIPLTNIIGMAYDSASTEMNHNFFINKLKEEVPTLILLKCLCHSAVLVASKALSKLPSSCEYMLYAIAKYISSNINKSAISEEHKQFFGVKLYKILKSSGTTWPVLLKFLPKLTDNWEILKQCFNVDVSENKNASAKCVLKILNNDRIKAYMLFLKYSLNFFQNFNALFQSRKILIHKLAKSSEQLIMQIGQNFLLPASLQDISLNTVHPKNYLPLNEIYVGPECDKLLQSQKVNFANEVRSKCLDFYISVTKDMIKLLPFNSTVLRNLKFLNFELALSYEGRSTIKDLTNIAARFGTFDTTTLGFEWRVLPAMFNDADKKSLAALDIDDMWKKICEKKNFDDKPMFPNLKKLVQAILSLPHTDAEFEKIVSVTKNVKNKKRNRISITNLNAICKFQSFQAKTADYNKFHVNAKHLELHNSQNLYFNDNLDEDSLI